ncbi:MAG TPA: DegT/DnrJ/EryC1/StrS family aminotransferase [Candidatus Binatia bacterium]|nr:DegT/DnrJ/EryC1/StrS family aminotransferase [Candidatus Binatia bacterium]
MAKIPIIDLKAQYKTIRKELQQAIAGVLESQHFILGEVVEEFEAETAAYLGAEHAIGVASGSDALLLSLMALGIGAGDSVIVPTFTFVATATAVARLGATPVFADIEPESFLISQKQIAMLLADKKTAARVKAIIPVHLFGRMCAMKEIAALANKHRVRVVEDAAQAFGARAGGKAAGTIGDLGCYSFFPTKNLGGVGDGGLVATGDDALADKIKLLRAHGEDAKYRHDAIGVNSRLDAIQAAALGVKLRRVDSWCRARRERAAYYGKLFHEQELLGGGVKSVPDAREPAHAFNYYVIRAEPRDALKNHLAAAGIQTEIYYPTPLHLQPCFSYLGYRRGDFPVAEKAAAEALALPLYPELTEAQQKSVVENIAAFYRR